MQNTDAKLSEFGHEEHDATTEQAKQSASGATVRKGTVATPSATYYMITSQYYDHITILYDHITILYDHITILYDHITILYDHIIRSSHQMKAQRIPSVLSSHCQATTKHPKANIRLRVRNRHIKSVRKDVIPGRKRALVKDNGKSFGGKLRMVASYTFYRRIRQPTS